MKTVGAFEAKTHFSALLAQVQKGVEITITSHGKPVAKLVSIENKKSRSSKEVVAAIQAFAKKQTLGKVSWKTLRDEGRK